MLDFFAGAVMGILGTVFTQTVNEWRSKKQAEKLYKRFRYKVEKIFDEIKKTNQGIGGCKGLMSEICKIDNLILDKKTLENIGEKEWKIYNYIIKEIEGINNTYQKYNEEYSKFYDQYVERGPSIKQINDYTPEGNTSYKHLNKLFNSCKKRRDNVLNKSTSTLENLEKFLH